MAGQIQVTQQPLSWMKSLAVKHARLPSPLAGEGRPKGGVRG